MVIGYKLKLTNSMSLRLGIDPEEKVLGSANTDGELIFRRSSKRRVNDINVTNDHRTP